MAKGLRKLIRRFPTPEEVSQVLGSLSEQSDRSYAIMVCALVDGMAERLLIQRMVNREPEMLARLFEERGPLATFDSKILMLEALDVIPLSLIVDMRLIKTIRNVFAHSAADISFETDEIREAVRQASFVRFFKDNGFSEREFAVARQAFSIICTWLLMSLSDLHSEQGGEGLIEAQEVNWDE